MSVGLPVVATKCGGPESIVLPETGILVEKNDENKLCAAMDRIIKNYDNYESSVIRKIALKTYGDKPYANKIRNAINSVLWPEIKESFYCLYFTFIQKAC